jgi:hypothetical protein
MYNPFDEAMIGKVAARVEAALALESRRVFVVYINPRFGGCFDAIPSLRRQFTGQIPCAREELGFGTIGEELVTVWQGGCDDRLAPLAPQSPCAGRQSAARSTSL